MTGPGLIYCIGAAKSGTSWLHDYLRGHGQVHLRALKELHYFDVLEPGLGKWQYKALVRQAGNMRDRLRAGLGNAESLRERLADLEAWLETFDGETADDAAYLAYLRQGAGAGARWVGDFTPAYALLSEATFAHMAGLAGETRFVYLLRDPVERAWSNIRMVAKNAGAADPEALHQRELRDLVAGNNRKIALRSDYRGTLERLFRAVPRAQVHVEFYERLFTPRAIERLCGFLGIEVEPAAFERRVHKGREAGLEPAGRAALAAWLKPQYEYVKEVMGGLPRAWTDRMVDA